MSQTLTPHALLRETSHVLLLFQLTPEGAWFRCPVATAKATLTATGSYDHIWWRCGFLTTPHEVTWPQILMLYNHEVWNSRGTISVTCCRNRCPFASQNVLCVRSLSTSRIYKFAKRALLQLSPQSTTSVNFCILLSSYYNRPTYSTHKKLWLEDLNINS